MSDLVLALVRALADGVAEVLSAPSEDEQIEAALRASRKVHDAIARRKFGGG